MGLLLLAAVTGGLGATCADDVSSGALAAGGAGGFGGCAAIGAGVGGAAGGFACVGGVFTAFSTVGGGCFSSGFAGAGCATGIGFGAAAGVIRLISITEGSVTRGVDGSILRFASAISPAA